MARIIGVLYDPNARHSRVSKVVVDTPATAFFVFSVAKSSSWGAFHDQPQSCWGVDSSHPGHDLGPDLAEESLVWNGARGGRGAGLGW